MPTGQWGSALPTTPAEQSDPGGLAEGTVAGTENPLDPEDAALPSWGSPPLGLSGCNSPQSPACGTSTESVTGWPCVQGPGLCPPAAHCQSPRAAATRALPEQLPQDPAELRPRWPSPPRWQAKVALGSAALTASPRVYTAPISLPRRPPPRHPGRAQGFRGSPRGHRPAWPPPRPHNAQRAPSASFRSPAGGAQAVSRPPRGPRASADPPPVPRRRPARPGRPPPRGLRAL